MTTRQEAGNTTYDVKASSSRAAPASDELIARVMNARKEGGKDIEAAKELLRRAKERNKDALRRLAE